VKTACIYCFSGTGNTLLASRRLADGLERKGVPTTILPFDADTRVPPGTTGLGITFPVACQSTYPFVWRFLEALPPGDGRAVFIMDTLHAYSGGLLGPLRKLLIDKGYEPLGAAEIIMPSNLRLRQPKQSDVESVIEKAMQKVDEFAEALGEGRAVWPKAGRCEGLLYKLSRSRFIWWFGRWWMNLRHNCDRCCECGFCHKLCPVGALRPDQTPVIDRKTCEICMRCYSYCPVGAIRSRFPWKPYHAVALGDLLPELDEEEQDAQP
jgi:ferredoxin